MKIFTSGMLKTYIECPAKYNLIYNENLQIPTENTFLQTGNEIHSLINYYYKGFDISKMTDIVYNGKSALLKDLWNIFLEMKPPKLLKSEYTFNTKLGVNIILTGRIDGIYRDGKSYVITDWKTGSDNLDIERDMQTVVYLYSLYKLLKLSKKIDKFEDLSIEYYFLKTKKIKKAKYTDFKEIEKNIISLTNKINAESQFLKASSVNCQKCEFKNFCSQAFG